MNKFVNLLDDLKWPLLLVCVAIMRFGTKSISHDTFYIVMAIIWLDFDMVKLLVEKEK